MKFDRPLLGFLLTAAALFPACKSTSGPLRWTEVEKGVWRTEAGNPDVTNLLKVAEAIPNREAIQRLAAAGRPDFLDAIEMRTIDHRVFIRIPLERDEEIYGLGLNFKTLNQRGRILRLHTDHYGGRDDGRTHAPVPFYVSSRGYGLLVNSARYIDIWVGTAVRRDSPNPPVERDRNTDAQWSAQPYSDGIEMALDAEGAEILLFEGPKMLTAIQRYNLFCGGGPIPPKWGLGFWQRVPTLFTDKQVKEEVAAFAEHDFPLDVIGLEPGWMSASYPCTYEWDSGRFPDPAGFMREMDKSRVRINLWMNPYISSRGRLDASLKPYFGTHTVWCGPVPDYTRPEARGILTRFIEEEHLSIGVSGYKIDEIDGYDSWLWPDSALFPSGLTGEPMRQVYGLQMLRMVTDQFHKRNQRTYGLARANNAGGNSLPFVIYNDYYSHPDFINALVNSGFIGVLWTPEVRASGSAEEWLRRFQTVCFSPLAMINAWADGTKPWTFPEVYPQVREYARLRMQLLPYLYSAFADYHFEGIPPFRATGLDENKVIDRRDQYMVGPSLLVAPLFSGQAGRTVVLPPGKWFDFFTGEYAGEDETIEVTPGLDKIPVFARDGALIPMIEPANRVPGPGEKPAVTWKKFGDKPGSFMLYEDDGVTFEYERGQYSRARHTGNQSSD